ncbi:MAG: 50S ribosomal protein L24 [Candidatus Nanoarchaeia archaeon]
MKKQFSNSWRASIQPRKQRKFVANAPMHIKHKLMSANLSKELKKRYNRKSAPVRKGDLVIIMRGEFKKKSGKIASVNAKMNRVAIEGIQRTKKDGTKVNVFFNASKLKITELNLDDKKRLESISKNNKEKKENAPKKK